MKAAVYYGKTDMRVSEIEVREPEADEIVVQVAYCGICGTDVHIFNGEDGAYAVTPPLVPGHEFSGIVVKAGKNVTNVTVGDRVSCDPNDMCGKCEPCMTGRQHYCRNVTGIGTTVNGGFAEYVTLHSKQAYKIADDLELIEAAMAEPLSCCLHGIDLCHIKPGDTVLVMGGGPIGMIMLQLAKKAGATQLILSEPVESKRNLALTLGATAVIDPLSEDVPAFLESHCDNVDVVIECIGNPHTQSDAIQYAGICATVMFFGLSDPGQTFPIQINDVFKKELHLTSSYINPYTYKRAIKILESHSIDVKSLIDHVFPVEKLPEVLADDSYRKNGKVMIQLNDLK